MKLNFKVDEAFRCGIERLAATLGYTCAEDGITVTAQKGEKIGVACKDGAAVIYYRERVQFYRGIGLLLENLKKSARFEVFEDGFFVNVSTMIDASRAAVPSVVSAKRLLDHLAVMGYSSILLYTEDVIELEGRPYFGYMRGRYTVEELREIDDYAFAYGIELIPCLECYGHMEKYLIWPEAAGIKDTAHVLLAREEKTFAFLEQLIATVSGALRSRRIHIGMDEAWDMGRGNFLNRNGYVPPFEIFNEFMERLISITNKYGLTPMMWSDMYFRISSASGSSYYDKNTVIPAEVKQCIPKEVELVFWHYGEAPECDGYMLEMHRALDRKILFAGGAWGWTGHFPEHNYMMKSTRFSLNACRESGVREAIFTVWRDDNAECDIFANLYGLSFFAEMCYNPDATEEQRKSRFEISTGGDYDLFYKMCYYHNDFENTLDYKSLGEHFFGKPLFWQDVLEGLYDSHLFEKKMSEHYAQTAALYQNKGKDTAWGYLYEQAYRTLDYLATKTYIAERLVPAYKAGDKATLKALAEEYFPLLKEKTESVRLSHRAAWLKNNKAFGWQTLDVRYGGVLARCDTAIMLIRAYLDGEISRIEELDEPRLPKSLSGFVHYSNIATVHIKI
ncbi:MAG: beta-N-acetylhexosaminidase [Clostridia bacterium]|nr:beta-N-acetylhexosaminidase [Clostridia bacterium]